MRWTAEYGIEYEDVGPLVNYFPSSVVRMPGSEEYRFDGVGFQFVARGMHANHPDLAFTISGGITLKYRSFRSFPLMAGVEWVYPRSVERTVMFYAGGNAGFHFIGGDLGTDQQTKCSSSASDTIRFPISRIWAPILGCDSRVFHYGEQNVLQHTSRRHCRSDRDRHHQSSRQTERPQRRV